MAADSVDPIRKVWETHPDEAYRRDQSHWRGHGRWADEEMWQGIGKRSKVRLDLILRYMGIDLEKYWSTPRTALEWGPGGGANVFGLSPYCKYYIGVDIAQSNLTESGRLSEEIGFKGFVPVLIDSDISVVAKQIPEKLDIFLSTAVFQHFPGKEYGSNVLATISSICKPQAIGSIQIRFDNGNPRYRPIASVEEYGAKHLTANSYAIDEFQELCHKHGLEVLFVNDIRLTNNYANFSLRKVR